MFTVQKKNIEHELKEFLLVSGKHFIKILNKNNVSDYILKNSGFINQEFNTVVHNKWSEVEPW